MKNYILAIATALFLISCGKNEKAIELEKNNVTIIANLKEPEVKEVETPIYNYRQDTEFSEELDKVLLSKVATNLKINYEDIQIDKTSSISYNDGIIFFVITYIDKNVKMPNETEDDESVNFFNRIYVFANKSTGNVIDKEIDKDLSYSDDDVVRPSNTYISKKIFLFNETTYGIVLSTETSSPSRVALWSEMQMTIIALVDYRIKKLLYEYPIRKTQGDSNGGGSFEMETLETLVNVSNKKTNGFFDLDVAKTFSKEKEVEEDEEKGIKAYVAPVKTKNETERIQFDGKNYSFKKDDKYRFLKEYN